MHSKFKLVLYYFGSFDLLGYNQFLSKTKATMALVSFMLSIKQANINVNHHDLKVVWASYITELGSGVKALSHWPLGVGLGQTRVAERANWFKKPYRNGAFDK